MYKGGPYSQWQSQIKHVWACMIEDAGKTKSYSVSFRAYGDGVKYRAAWGEWSSPTSITVNCPNRPTSSPTPTITPTPTPTPTPPPTTGPLSPPPEPIVLGLSDSIHQENYDAWSIQPVVVLSWSYWLPNGITSIETDGIVGSATYTAGQALPTSTMVCWPVEAGKTALVGVRVRVYGDGVTFRAAWSRWGISRSLSLTCPGPPNSIPTPTPMPTVVPTPSPTPTPNPTQAALPLPPVPSYSVTSELNEANYIAWTDLPIYTVTSSISWADGVAKAEWRSVGGHTITWAGDQRPSSTLDYCYRAISARAIVSVGVYGHTVMA